MRGGFFTRFVIMALAITVLTPDAQSAGRGKPGDPPATIGEPVLIFQRQVGKGKNEYEELVVADRNGVTKGLGLEGYGPNWSPYTGGRRFVYSTPAPRSDPGVPQRLWIATLDDVSATLLGSELLDSWTSGFSWASGPTASVWNPSGGSIAYAKPLGGLPGDQIHVYDLATGSITPLTSDPIRAVYPVAYSSDGEHLLASKVAAVNEPCEQPPSVTVKIDLVVIDTSDGTERSLLLGSGHPLLDGSLSGCHAPSVGHADWSSTPGSTLVAASISGTVWCLDAAYDPPYPVELWAYANEMPRGIADIVWSDGDNFLVASSDEWDGRVVKVQLDPPAPGASCPTRSATAPLEVLYQGRAWGHLDWRTDAP